MNCKTYDKAVLKAAETLCGAYWLPQSATSARNELSVLLNEEDRLVLDSWIRQETKRATTITKTAMGKKITMEIIEPHNPHFPTYDEILAGREYLRRKRDEETI